MSFTSRTEAPFTVGKAGIVSIIFCSILVVSATTLCLTGLLGLVYLFDGLALDGNTDAYRYLLRREKVERQL